ncbi:MAG: MFS transporter [Pseudonocardia sp.]|nr:MFS transporter [Pseudonocardia sp.]
MNIQKDHVPALMVALLGACTAFQLNASMLSPVLPTIQRDLHTTVVAVGFSQTAFFTSAAIFAVFVPRLSDILGRRRVLLVSLALTTVGSILAAVAPGIGLLCLARVIQGCSGAVIAICLLILRGQVAEPKRYGTLMGVVAAVNGGVAGIDVFVGGWLATHVGFRAVFWVMVVVGAIATGLVARIAPESRPSAGTPMDWSGVVALALAVACLLLALNEAAKLAAAKWWQVAVFAIASVGAFVSFYQNERRAQHPLVRPAQLRDRGTWAVLLTTTLTLAGIFAAINGVVVSDAQDAKAGLGLSADTTSVVLLTPYALIGWAVGPLAGRFAPTWGYRRILRIGLVGSIVALAWIAMVGLHSLPMLVGGSLLLGIAYAGMANIMLNGLAVALSPPDRPGFLPGFNSGAFNLGAGLSFAILPAIQTIIGGSNGDAAGYAGAVALGVVITAAALGVSYLIPRPALIEVREPVGLADG